MDYKAEFETKLLWLVL